MDTLLNPILADNFGFSIEYISYIFMSLLVLYLAGVSFVYTLQLLKVDTRLICLLTFSIGLAGSIIMTDWQSIQGIDLCKHMEEPSACATVSSNDILSSMVLGSTNNDLCYSVKNVSNVTKKSLLATCDLSYCNNHTQSCDLLRNHSSFVDSLCSANNQTCYVCVMDSPLLVCYSSFDKTYFHMPLDEVLKMLGEELISDCEEGSGELLDENTYSFPCPVILEKNEIYFKTSQPLQCERIDSSLNELWTECMYMNDTSQCLCEGSRDRYNCFWNPLSRVNGDYCKRCRPVCLGEDHTLSFPQLVVGAILLAFSFPMGRMSLTILASDGLGEASQGPVMGIMVASGSFARFTGPLWGNAAYLFADHHTWLIMGILSLLQGLVLVTFIVLYKKLAGNKFSPEDSASNSLENSQENIGFSGSHQLLEMKELATTGVELLEFTDLQDSSDKCVEEEDEACLDAFVEISDEETLLSSRK